MKYLKKFQTNADYQAYKGGGDWVTPNVSIITEDDTIVFEPFVNTNNSITFPITLVQGDNGEIGVQLFQYVIENVVNSHGGYIFRENEDVFLLGGRVDQMGFVSDTVLSIMFSNPPVPNILIIYLWNTGVLTITYD